MLRRAGFTPQRSEDIRTAMWDKLLINAVINPLTGLLSVPNGALLENRESEDLMRRLLQEGVEVLTREGYTADNTIGDRVRTVCRQTAANSSSMLQDLTKGRKTEIEWINGYLLRLADKHGVDLPVNRTLYSLIKLKEGQG
ncbi:2-dehydropantoate 2-reductase [Paenibacillus sp. CC-CFT747]|nr:2-dehydropantoate 2-reductase [Paenibacillus sp. CC-CFT747]